MQREEDDKRISSDPELSYLSQLLNNTVPNLEHYPLLRKTSLRLILQVLYKGVKNHAKTSRTS